MKDILQLLEEANAIIQDSHIVGTSGKHINFYVNKDALYPHTHMSSEVGRMIAERHKDLNIDVVAAPALGGIVLSQWTAYHLSVMQEKDILSLYLEKDPKAHEGADKKMIFTRGYEKLVTGKNVLVVEDVTNTGGSCKKAVESVKEAGGNVIAACVIVNRNPNVDDAYIGAPFSALAFIKAEAYDEAECPMCKEGIPINTTVGHGKKYLEDRKAR